MTGGVGVAPSGRLFISPAAQRHLAWLAAVFFGLLAFGAWLDRPRLLIEASGLVFGASYADVAARMPAAWCRLAAALIGVALSIAAINRRLLLIAGAAGVYLAISFGGEAVASAVQRFVVAPNEQARETPYMEYNIEATRAAFGLDRVEERELSGDATLTRDDIDAQRRDARATSGSGITSRCSTRSARSRRSAPTTTSSRSTTTAT